MLEVMIALLAASAIRIVVDFVVQLWGARSGPKELPESLQADMSEYDKEKIEETQHLVEDCFCRDGKSVTDSIGGMSNLERIKTAEEFAVKLSELYGLDIKIDVNVDDPRACGAYNWADKKVCFNLVELMVDADHPDFKAHVENFIDTVIHEERHAVQHRAMTEPGFWNVTESVRGEWAYNLENYIRPEVDARGYRLQPIENDAFTFANLSMQGVRMSNE